MDVRAFRGTLLLSFGFTSALLVAACSKADNTDAALNNDPNGSAGATAGAAGKGGNAGKGGSGTGGDEGEGGTDAGGKGGAAGTGGKGGSAGKGGTGGSAGKGGTGGSAGKGGKGGTAGDGGSAGDAGEGGSDAGGAAGASGVAGASGASSGNGGGGGVPGWTCGQSLYDEQAKGEKYPQCNCNCGVRDPDCDNPFSYMKGCGTGQTCDGDGKCQGDVLTTPKEWTCGSTYYGVGGKQPVCNCGCGAPDPDCELPRYSRDLLNCGRGQTCDVDGKCSGPILTVPTAWKCAPSRWAEGKSSGTCDCDCGAPDPDCEDPYLEMTGCGFGQICSVALCEGAIQPAPAGWECPSEQYSDGKTCNCACGKVRDPDCDYKYIDLPHDCGEGSFCLSNKNECY